MIQHKSKLYNKKTECFYVSRFVFSRPDFKLKSKFIFGKLSDKDRSIGKKATDKFKK